MFRDLIEGLLLGAVMGFLAFLVSVWRHVDTDYS